MIINIFAACFANENQIDPKPQSLGVNDGSTHIACPYNSAIYNFQENSFESSIKTSAVIIPHHLLAQKLIDETLSGVNRNYETIILVGPNHKGIGQPPIQLSGYVWETQFGEIIPNRELVQLLEGSDQLQILEDYFDLEHSICGLVTFIKKYFPDAKILPITLKNNVSDESIDRISKKLLQGCNNCLVIASVDFSHEVTDIKADKNDTQSIVYLTKKNRNEADDIVSDCNQCIRFLYGFVADEDEFTLVEKSNSYKLTGESPDSVTSYISGYYASAK